MDLAELQRHWDTFGRQDPFWAILTDPAMRGNRWSRDAFFATGRAEIAEHLEVAARLGVPRRFTTALDFGCGAGRLTQALADHFDHVLGLDVAPSMIALAREHNRHADRCRYEVNDRADLARCDEGAFDLVYTSRVLQHIEPRYVRAYVREFVRVLAPGGYLSFDLPSASGDAAAMADGVVPGSAMRAGLVVSPAVPVYVTPGARLRLGVTVTNRSDVTWLDAPGRVLNVGNHWLSGAGELLRMDDVRAKLPVPLGPGAAARVDLTMTAPAEAGDYRLQFDVVQEGVAWFASCGSEPVDVPVRVVEAAAATQAHVPTSDPPAMRPGPVAAPGEAGTGRDTAPSDPVMEMHAVPRDEVERIVQDAGGRLLDVRRVYHCGPLWLAYRYDVTK